MATDTGARLKREREARGWHPRDLIEALRAAGWEQRTSDENVSRSIRRWESGGGIEDRTKAALAEVYGLAILTLFPPAMNEDDESVVEIDTIEIAERIRRRSLDESTLDGLVLAVDQLCTAYSTDPAEEVLADASRWFAEIERAIARPASPEQLRALFDQASWLALLIGCLYNDLGQRRRAETMRATAGHLGADAGNGRAVAWSHEMTAWFSLTDGEYRAAITAARAGQQVAPNSDVAVQMAGQEAEAWARLGDETTAREALDRGRQILDKLTWPDNPRNHFTVDAPKFRKSVMRVARFLGDDDLAAYQANEIIIEGRRPDGSHRQPMRVADAKTTLAAVAAGQGNVDAAVELTHEALDIDRVSQPSLLLATGEVLEMLPPTGAVQNLTERIQEVWAIQ